MKTSLKFLLVAAFLFAGASVSAQQKIGHINSAEIVSAMPETAEAEKSLQAFSAELQAQQNLLYNELTTKGNDYQKKVSNYSEAMRLQAEKELMDIQERLQQFTAGAQADISKKEQELMAPLITKLNEAVEAVSKESSFSYIFDIQQIMYADPSSSVDITPLVKTKLGIK